MQPLDLIASARRLLGEGLRGQPRQSDLKRAMSTAYYAMFHALCRNCADFLIGKSSASRSEPAWRQAYRAVDHGHDKTQCGNSGVMARFPSEIGSFAIKIGQLQEKRHRADYDLSNGFTRHDVLTEIDATETAIKRPQAANTKDRRAFAAWTVMKIRPG